MMEQRAEQCNMEKFPVVSYSIMTSGQSESGLTRSLIKKKKVFTLKCIERAYMAKTGG